MRTLGLLVVLLSVCLFAAGCGKKTPDKSGDAKKTGQTDDQKDKKDTPAVTKDLAGDSTGTPGKGAAVDDMPEIKEGKGKPIFDSMTRAFLKSAAEGGDDKAKPERR